MNFLKLVGIISAVMLVVLVANSFIEKTLFETFAIEKTRVSVSAFIVWQIISGGLAGWYGISFGIKVLDI